MDDAIETAKGSAIPQAGELWTNVYKGGWVGGRLGGGLGWVGGCAGGWIAATARCGCRRGASGQPHPPACLPAPTLACAPPHPRPLSEPIGMALCGIDRTYKHKYPQ